MSKQLVRLFRGAAFGAMLAVAIGPAVASTDGGTGPADVSDLKTMTANRSTSPAGCIGHGTTPMCAVETAAACEIWNDVSLCRAVGYRAPFELWNNEDYWRLNVFHYKEVAEHTLSRADIPDWATTLGEASWRPGDLASDVWFQVCRPSDACAIATQGDPRRSLGESCAANRCAWEVNPRTYILRQARGGWRVVYVYIPQWHQRDHWVPSWTSASPG